MEAVIPKEETYPTGATKWILIATAISCAVLELIDTTVVNVSLPEISGNIGATTTEIAWVITAYGIANVIVIPLSSMLSNLFGRKLYFTTSVALFTFASLMCGSSTSLWSLVFWRFIQGLGGGGLLSTAQSIIIGAFPPARLGILRIVDWVKSRSGSSKRTTGRRRGAIWETGCGLLLKKGELIPSCAPSITMACMAVFGRKVNLNK